MSFSYGFGSNPPIDYPRLLISDTVDSGHIFEDSEITAASNIVAMQFQSGQFYTFPGGVYSLPNPPVSYLRIAALLLDALAANKARLSSVIQLLDVKLSPEKASLALRDQAKSYRETDDDAGAMVLIEQCPTTFSFIDRYWAQVQRGQIA